MKKIFLWVTYALAAACLFSCEKKMDNSDFSDMLKSEYNQEALWNLDSLAFRRAAWETTELSRGAVMNTAQVKMLGSVQTITYLTYSSDGLETKIGYPERMEPMSGNVERRAIFSINGGPFSSDGAASFVKIDGGVANGTVSTSGIGFTATEDGNKVEIICGGSLIPYADALGAVAPLVMNGEEQEIEETPENLKRMARSIFGVTKNGRNVMAVIDGGVTGKAEGATMAEAAFIARIIGMYNAVALSGGDASSLWVREQGGTVTSPSAGSEADVATYLYVTPKAYFSGYGTEDEPYLITEANEMKNIAKALVEDETTYFRMKNDVDMQGIAWVPINYQNNNKRIVFDGDGHTISNFTCTDSHNYLGFFGVLNGECRNVSFVNAYVSDKNNDTSFGIIGGYIGSNSAGTTGLVENCRFHGVLENRQPAVQAYGGVCGKIECNSIVRNCYVDVECKESSGATTGNIGVGGVVGEMSKNNNKVENCFVTGSVSAGKGYNAGGVVGRAWNAGTGNAINNNISWVTSVVGRAAAGEVCGRFGTAYATEEGNYSKTGISVTTQGKAADFRYHSNNADYALVGTPTDNATAAAKTLGWDEDIWDLSGETPELKLFKK